MLYYRPTTNVYTISRSFTQNYNILPTIGNARFNSPFLSKLANRLVTIYVRPEKVKFKVLKDALCRFSGFARSKIEANQSSGLRLFKPEGTYIIELEDVTPEIFSTYYKFLIDKTFNLTDITNNGPLSKLVELSVLAHVLQDPLFSDTIVKAVSEYVENAVSLSPRPTNLPYLAKSFAAAAVILDTTSVLAGVAKILARLAIVKIKETIQASIVRYEGQLKERNITIKEKQEQIKQLKQKNKEMQRI